MMPWNNPQIEAWLANVLSWNATVFEWGPGASTQFFIDHVHAVHAVEDQQKYADELLGALSSEQKQKLRLRVIPGTERKEKGEPEDPTSYLDPAPGSFRTYVQAVYDWPYEYDLIYVDGRARASCLRVAQTKVCKGGWVLLHDAERAEYAQGVALYEAWEGVTLPDSTMVRVKETGGQRLEYRELKIWRKP